jgi:hypothetical protein
MPVATKALAAGPAKECRDELPQDVILAAWDFDEAARDDEDDDRGNNDDDDAFTDAGYGHDDLEKAGPMMTTTIAADRDDSNDGDEPTLLEWKLWSGGIISR